MRRTLLGIAAALVAVAVIGSVATPTLLRGRGTAQTMPTHTIDRGDMVVSVKERGTLESANNTEIKCRVRGSNTITFVIDSGSEVQQGAELLRLETLAIEEEISERTKFYHLAESQVARSAADVARAKLAIEEYMQGRFVSELASLQKELAIAESRLLNARNRLKHSRMMERSEYASELEVEEKAFAVDQAERNVELLKSQIDLLENYTKREELTRLQGELRVAEATLEADIERAMADKKRLERAAEELEWCTIVAPRAGLVIYPAGEQWEDAPKIEEGATVNKDQTLLLMPDLTQMQVKVGIHESIIDRVQTGMQAVVVLNRTTLPGEVTYVAEVAKPAGWWTGNVVKYDATVSLPATDGLRPGMSAQVEIVIARHEDVLRIPINACLEIAGDFYCWVQDQAGLQRRSLRVGDSNELFLVALDGVGEGEQVVLDPLDNVPEAQQMAAAMLSDDREQRFGYEDL